MVSQSVSETVTTAASSVIEEAISNCKPIESIADSAATSPPALATITPSNANGPGSGVSSDTNKVLSLLNETLDVSTSISTAQSTARTECTLAIPPSTTCDTSACAACEAIAEAVERYAIEGSPRPTHNPPDMIRNCSSVKQIGESVWQVGDIETANAKSKPPTHSSAISSITSSAKPRASADSAAFIVIDNDRLDDDGKLKPLKNSPISGGGGGDSSRSNCTECNECYICKHESHPIGCSDASCTRCHPTQAKQETSRAFGGGKKANDLRRSSTYLETRTKSNHSHTHTKSKDTDTISMECRKMNKKVSRYIPVNAVDHHETERSHHDGNANDGPHIETATNDTAKEATTTSSIPKLPPSSSDWSTSSNSCDAMSSANESPVLSASPRQRRHTERHSVPHLPTAERWFNAANNKQKSSAASQRTRTNSRYEEFYGSKVSTAEESNKLAEVGSTITTSDGSVHTRSSGRSYISHFVDIRISYETRIPNEQRHAAHRLDGDVGRYLR